MPQPCKIQYIIQIATGKQLLIWKTLLITLKQLGQFYCQLLVQVQKRCNSSVIPIFTHFIVTHLCHFTNQAQGDRRMIFHPEIDNKYFYLGLKPNARGFFTKKIKCQKIYHRKCIEIMLVNVTLSLRYQRGP